MEKPKKVILISTLVVGLVAVVLLALSIFGNNESDTNSQEIETPPLASSHFFTDIECSSGCWQGLIPEVSTEEEVLAYFNSHPFQETLSTELPNYTILEAHHEDLYTVSSIIDEDGTLSGLEVWGATDLNLGTVVENLGPPVSIDLTFDTGTEVLENYVYLTMYYPTNGFTFFSTLYDVDIQIDSEDMANACIRESQIVLASWITSPGTINSIIETNSVFSRAKGQEEIETEIAQLLEWPGFICAPIDIP